MADIHWIYRPTPNVMLGLHRATRVPMIGIEVAESQVLAVPLGESGLERLGVDAIRLGSKIFDIHEEPCNTESQPDSTEKKENAVDTSASARDADESSWRSHR